MVEHVGDMVGVSFNLISDLEFKSWNVVVFCDRVLPLLWSLSTRIDVVYMT